MRRVLETRAKGVSLLKSVRSRALYSSSQKTFHEIPRIPALPVIGSSWIYFPLIGRYDIRDSSQAAWDIHRRLGPIVAEHLPGRRVLVRLFNADDIRTLYREEGRTPRHVGALPLKLYHYSRKDELFANDGLLHAQGEEWRRIRCQTHSSVSDPHTIREYAKTMARISEDAVRLVSSLRDDEGEVEDCHAIMRRWALESIIFVAISKRMGVLDKNLDSHSQEASVLNAVDDTFATLNTLTTKFPYYRYFRTPLYRRFVQSSDEAFRYFFPLVLRAAEQAASTNSEDNHRTLVANLQRVAKLNLLEVFTFIGDVLVAGAETTASAATFCLYCLASSTQAQERARKEVFSVISPQGPSNYSQLHYVKACIKETLRFYPVVPAVHRKLDHDVVMSGYVIPKNTVLRTEFFVSGRLEENFTRASEFVPERWLRTPEQEVKGWTLHPFASLPFSTGPRMCIGRRIAEMELCTLVAQVLLNYRVENYHGDIGFNSQLTSRPKRPARFRFTELKAAERVQLTRSANSHCRS